MDRPTQLPPVDRPALWRRLDGCLLRDRRRLRRRLRDADPDALNHVREQIDASVAAAEKRLARLAALTIRPDPGLPINRHREAIKTALREHQVIVVCGETGSGKTTQLPQICLELGLGARGLIGHTQPRRLAARSVSARIAAELATPLGELVGYKVRFSDRLGPHTAVKLMTDGILLAETQGERRLDSYQALIVDEAHERSLNIDFLLGYLRQLLPRRPDLRLVVTSATIDPQRFSRHFDHAPVIEVSGRGYPVELRYRPLAGDDDDERDRGREQAILDAVDELSAGGQRGDILIFLSGEREIRDCAESLRKHKLANTEVLPLYARLSATEQNRVFQPSAKRRIVLATNVAETSLTVPGIRFVIDPGTARISRYSHRAKVQRLPIEKISRASAAQRAGRCGRVAPGVCIRLYAEDDFNARPEFTDPEILRTSLAAVILQMAVLKLGEVEDFPFLDPPDRRQITDGYKLLFELQAVDDQRRITELGRRLARLPIDPRLARMLLAADERGCLAEALVIASALTVQDPRERPLDRQQAADEKHRRFRDEKSDFSALLKLWRYFQDSARALSKNRLRTLCRDEFLSFVRLREWQELYRQLHALTAGMGLKPNDATALPADYAALHQALLSGLLGHVGMKQPQQPVWLGARGRKFYIFPGSGLFKRQPRWLMAAELTETTRLYARTCAEIDPRWAEQAGRHLLKRSYSAAHWQRRAGQVAAKEQVTLYGLPLAVGRRVNYGPLAPAEARDIFIRDALVGRQLNSRAAFLRHNAALLDEVEELETRGRRRDLLADEQRLYDFYAARLPQGIYSAAAFERWRKRAEREQPRLLYFDRELLFAQDPPDEKRFGRRFPDRLELDGLTLPLSYRFDPGADDDGVTLKLPLAALNQVDPRRLEWLVPGLLGERMATLLKSLPKTLRKNFVPVPNFVTALLESLTPDNVALADAMAARLEELTGLAIPEQAWNPAILPAHLSLRVEVLDADGQVLAAGRDLAALQRRLGERAAASFDALPTPEYERDRVRDWDFGALPGSVEFQRNGVTLQGYPALVETDSGSGDAQVALRLLDSPQRAERQHRAGLRRLLAGRLRDKLKYLKRNLPQLQTLSLHYVGVGSQAELRNDLSNAILDRALFGEQPPPRDRAGFDACLARGRERLLSVANQLSELVGAILARHHAARTRLAGPRPAGPQQAAWTFAAADIDRQLQALVYPGFISATPPRWLAHLPRYLQAVELRLDKLVYAPDKDRQRMADIDRLWRMYLSRAASHAERGVNDAELELFRWMIEELRVSQFAQELKTALPVSVKRLEAQWQKVAY